MAEATDEKRTKEQQLNILHLVFTPTSPIEKKSFFAGRIKAINSVVDAILQRGQHPIIFGERGVGKTSLANIIQELCSDNLIIAISVDMGDTFSTIWKKILKRYTLVASSQSAGFKGSIQETIHNLDEFIGQERELKPDDIIYPLEQLRKSKVIVIDEFDRLQDISSKGLLADTLKALSDKLPEVTLVFVGVGQSIIDLIGQHPSVERNLKQIHLKRMTDTELEEIIDKGLKVLNLEIEASVRAKIISFSSGFPHYTHLLARNACRHAINEGAGRVSEKHFESAVDDAITDAQESIRDAYYKANMSPRRKNIFKEVILACAIATEDENGAFRATDLVDCMRKITGDKRYVVQQFYSHLGVLCKVERGRILEKIGTPNRFRYKFSNPLMKAYVKLRAHSEGLTVK